MTSKIFYKMKNETTPKFISFDGPGLNVGLVKKSIMNEEKMNTKTMEFDLSLKNAQTGEGCIYFLTVQKYLTLFLEYRDDDFMIQKSTSLTVQRMARSRARFFKTSCVRLSSNLLIFLFLYGDAYSCSARIEYEYWRHRLLILIHFLFVKLLLLLLLFSWCVCGGGMCGVSGGGGGWMDGWVAWEGEEKEEEEGGWGQFDFVSR